MSMPPRRATAAALTAIVALYLAAGCAAQETGAEGSNSSTRADLYSEMAAGAKESLISLFPDAQVPPVEIVRYIAEEDWGTTMASCLTAQGFGAKVRDDGGLDYDPVAAGQEQAQAIAKYTCDLQYPVEQAEVTDEQLRVLYDYNVNELLPCLAREGYPVAQAPSFTTYKETYNSATWVPYSEVPPITQKEFDDLNRVCPQLPEELGGRVPAL